MNKKLLINFWDQMLNDMKIFKGIPSSFYALYPNAVTHTTVAGANNTLRAILFYVPETLTITSINSEVTTSYGGATYRLGIYTNGTTNYPDQLVSGSDTGTYDASGNAVRSASVSITLTGNTYYWLAFTTSSSATAYRAYSTGYLNIGVSSTIGVSAINAITVSLAYGALPQTFTLGGTGTLVNPILVCFGVA